MSRKAATSLDAIPLLPSKGRGAIPEPLPTAEPAHQEPTPILEAVPPEPRVAMTYRPRFATHRALKVMAAQRGVTMQDILDQVIDNWIARQR